MRSISTKLFFALLSLTAVVLFATLFLARWSFDYGFLDYLNAQQQLRLNNMASDLSIHYEDNGGRWSESSEKAYRDIYRKWFPGPTDRPPRPDRPPPPADYFHSDGPPSSRPLEVEQRLNNEANDLNGKPQSQGASQRRPRGSRPPKPFEDPMVVYDKQGAYVAGNSKGINTKAMLSAPIKYQETIVGEIQAQKKVKFSLGVESSFSKQQTKASFIVATLSLLIAGIASWFLARMLLAPTYKMTHAIGGLVKGDFASRLEVGRDDELGQLMLDINRLSEALQQNQLSRKRWLADISHELRTPVAILSGELEAVLDGIRPLNQQAIESLNHEVTRLKHLIDDLYQLSLSDIGGLRYEFNVIDITELIGVVIGQHKSRLDSAGITLELSLQGGLQIEADASRLEQLLTNLLNNSIAYTNAPGQLVISLEQKNDYAVIRFVDSAPGVDADQLEEIFEPLYRDDDSRNRRKAGAGLGLTISQNIVQGHQGAIDVKKSALGGLEFTVTLPIKRI